ncbi:MAG: helix-turn-helix domain-containing protein [Pedobacter sp.]|uniref:helix-turn-helix domain-containing protein n=1 Tax=Pedobacter sp. TaxID=1411316 RepID=UPI003397FF64
MNLLHRIPEKRFCISKFSPELEFSGNLDENKDLTKIIYMEEAGSITVDFKKFYITGAGIFFIRPGQYVRLSTDSRGIVISYTRHQYSADIEDKELIFSGVQFNGAEEMPGLSLDACTSALVSMFLTQLMTETECPDSNQEFMIRSLINQLIVVCNRVWRKQYDQMKLRTDPDHDFYHYFDRLVERNFIRHHSVSAYALMLNISPKALNKRVAKYSSLTPSDIIHKRIILEAKRLLIHTPMSVKEIGFHLGYEDPSYFIRFFSKQANMAPQNFRKRFQSSLNAVA